MRHSDKKMIRLKGRSARMLLLATVGIGAMVMLIPLVANTFGIIFRGDEHGGNWGMVTCPDPNLANVSLLEEQPRRHEQRSIPPLCRLAAQKPQVTDTISLTYRGEYGWRFVRYIPSKLEEDFYADIKGRTRDDEYPDLIQRYRSRVDMLLEESKGRVAPGIVSIEPSKMAKQCDAEELQATMPTTPQCFGQPNVTAAPSTDIFSRFVYEFTCLGNPCDPATFPKPYKSNAG